MEEAITFTNKNGKKLFGILHTPETTIPGGTRIGINLLNPGIKYRVAPHRMNVKLARKLCSQGYYVLRFDPEGIGDSEGELPENLLTADIWEKIQKGLFIQDVKAANNFLIETCSIQHLLLIGNCGGAITALVSSPEDRRVRGLVLVDVPVNLRTAQQTFADKVAPGSEKADWLFIEYLKRVTRPESWYRFLTLKTDYRALVKTVLLKSKKFFLPLKQHNTKHDIEQRCEKYNLNPLFYKSFELFTKAKNPILFVIAGNDKGAPLFQQHFQSIYLNNSSRNKNLTIQGIDGANHIYTLYEWQEKLFNTIENWIAGISHGTKD